jgi:hypothetical protein
MRKPILRAVGIAGALIFASGSAWAEDVGRIGSPAELHVPPDALSAHFGVPGQFVVSSDAGLFVSNTHQTGRSGSMTTTELRPAVDYFLIDPFSIGGFVGLDYSNVPGGHSAAFSIGPRVGYDIRMTSQFSVWARAGVSFATTNQTVDAQTRTETINGAPVTTRIPESTTNTHNLAVNIFFPILFHPVDHFFIGFGPALDADFTGGVKATTLAARLTIGGWL